MHFCKHLSCFLNNYVTFVHKNGVKRLFCMMKQPQLDEYLLGQGVVAFSSTRLEGYGTGPYAAFNINTYCGDNEEAIQKNRMALCQWLGIADDHLLMPHQVHLTEIAFVDDSLMQLSVQQRLEKLEGKDAVMTNLRGVCIGVSTADCIPVLLYDPQQQVVCAIHAGWRGTVSRIVEKSIQTLQQTFGTHPSDLIAQIGPGISLESFEVGDEVYDAFVQAGFNMQSISRKESKWHIDLPVCNRQQLLQMGVAEQNIHVSSACTFIQHDRYFSARRLGIRSGRIYTGIMLK